MNDKQITEYLEKLRKISLSDSSRKGMKQRLLEYADFHAYSKIKNKDVRNGEEVRSIGEGPKGVFIGFIHFKLKYMTALLIAIVLIGGGTSYAAVDSVPGDVLYPVKVGVNENVRSAFAVSSSAETKVQAALVAERLKEAETLAAKGELSSEVSLELRNRLENHFNSALEESNKAAAAGDVETSAATRASLSGMFEAYTDILTRIDAQLGRNDSAEIVSDIRGYASTTAKADANVSADARVNVEALITTSTNLIADVRTMLTDAKTKLSSEAQAHIAVFIDDAARAEADAKAAFTAENYAEAYTHAQKAIRLAQKVETMIQSSLSLDLKTGIKVNDILNIGVSSDTDNEMENTEGDTHDQDSGSSTDADANGSVDVEVDTDGIDVDANTNTSIKTKLGV